MVAKMLASMLLEMATIACSNSPAPTSPKRLLITGVELLGVGHVERDVVDVLLEIVNGEDLVTERHRLARCRGAAEATEPDDDDRLLHATPAVQPIRIVSTAGRWDTGRARAVECKHEGKRSEPPDEHGRCESTWDQGGSVVVSPLVRPTVARAETASNARSTRRPLPVSSRPSVTVDATATDSSATASARYTTRCGITGRTRRPTGCLGRSR